MEKAPPHAPDANTTREVLSRQMDMGWQLASYHLDTLTTGECLWRPARRGLHVHQDLDGAWTADWPEHEGYDLGPSSIAWMTWHFGFWWSMALDHNFGGGTLAREDVKWPGSAEAAREWIRSLHGKWAALLAGMTEEELASTAKVRWPFEGLPVADLFAWANTELVKSASEIGYARFLFAARQGE